MAYANILTEDELKEALQLDQSDSYSFELNMYNSMTASFIYEGTGKDWGADSPVDDLAKACAMFVIQKLYYHDEDHAFKEEIEDLINKLRWKAMEEESNG